MKNTFLTLLILGGGAFMAHSILSMNSISKRTYLVQKFGNEFNVDNLTNEEIDVMYEVLSKYGHPNNAPSELQMRFIQIANKHNIAT